MVLKLEYYGKARSKPLLQMTWLLVSPGHQLPWYWIYRINRGPSQYKDAVLPVSPILFWKVAEIVLFAVIYMIKKMLHLQRPTDAYTTHTIKYMHSFVVLCFVVVILSVLSEFVQFLYPYSSDHCHWGNSWYWKNYLIVPVPVASTDGCFHTSD